MRFEDMKKEIPETPEFIHTMIQAEVKRQLEKVDIQTRRRHRWTGMRVAAAIAIGVLVTSTVAYAGMRIYRMVLEKQGSYSVTTEIKAEEGAGEMKLPEKIHDIDIKAEYIPEGMEWVDEFHLEYPEHDRTGGFSFSSVLLDENDLSKVMQDKDVIDCEERTFGAYDGVYLRYHDFLEDGSFNQRIYLLCPDLYHVITIYIGDDISKEEAMKVVENLVITENDTILETADMYTWSELIHPEEVSEEVFPTKTDGKLPLHQIGESFNLWVMGEDNAGNYMEEDEISVCVDSVQVEDDLQLIGENNIPEEWTDVIGDDGKLVNNTLSYMKSGDGVDSLDEIVKTESVKQKLVYVTLTYTNKSENEMNHMLYCGALMLMNRVDGNYQIYIPTEQAGEGYDRIIWEGAADIAEMKYYSMAENDENGDNYIPSLKPGESVEVNMAWIVNENDLDNMYLNLSGDGAAYEFTDSMLEVGLVDIRQ